MLFRYTHIFRQGVLRLLLLVLMFTAGTRSLWADEHADLQRLIARGDKAVKGNQMTDAVRCYLQAHNLALKAGDHSSEFWVQYKIGSAYFSISENGEALNHFYEALQLCDRYKLGLKERSRVLNGISGVYYEQENYAKSKQYMLEAFSYCVKLRDSVSYVAYACDLALIANRTGEFSLSRHYTRLGEQHLKRGDNYNRIRLKVIEADALFKQHKYAETELLCKEILLANNIGPGDRAAVLVYMIHICMDRGDMAKAIEYSNQAIRVAPLRNKVEVFDVMSTLYQRLGDYRTALRMKDSTELYTDSVTKVNNRQLVENGSIKIELIKLNQDMERKTLQLRRHTFIAIALVVLCLFVIFVGWLMVRNEKIRSRQAHQLMDLKLEKEKREKELAETKMRETELMAKYQKQLLQSSLEQKQHELSATTVFVAGRNQLISEVLKQFAEIPESEQDPKIKQIIQDLQQALHQGEQNEKFHVEFESQHPDFVHNLEKKHPGLSASDIHFLSYVRMNLSIKDIAMFMNITPDSCKRRKNRISKKLGLSNASELNNYITAF